MERTKPAMRNLQIEMAMKNRQMMIAEQMANGKERFKYFKIFMGLVATATTLGAIKTRDPKLLAPLFPLSVLCSFQHDMFNGNMQLRARQTAADLIKNEPERFFLPQGSGLVTD